MAMSGKQPAQVVLDPGNPDRAWVPSRELGTAPVLHDSFLVDLPSTLVGSAQSFPDDDMILSRAVWTSSRTYGVVGDANLFGNYRVVVNAFSGNTVTPAQILTGIEDPVWLVASPHDDGVLVASGFGDGLWWMAPTGNPAAPYTASELSYVGAAPALPGGAVAIRRGSLAGHTLVAENVGIRQVEITPTGAVDQGMYPIGTGQIADIVGAIGVQP